MILIGTSGFSYEDWRGAFYPPGLDKRDFLSYYAAHFPLLELNSSYYAIPSPALTAALIERTPENFQVVVKAYKGITHERGPTSGSSLEAFLNSIEPLRQAGKLAAILLQFPFSFHFGDHGLETLDSLLVRLAEYPCVVEFRNVEWRRKRVWELLRAREVALCCVDEPRLPGLLPPEVVRTSTRLGYVRFHGRNAEKWYEHAESWERYEYLYSRAELQEWAPGIRWLESRTEKTLVLFNNHRNGNAVKNARDMAPLLGLPESSEPAGTAPQAPEG